MRRTKIVATIGPASRDVDTLERMVGAGMDVARLNFSHGTREDHAETAQRVRTAAERAGRQVAILQDLPGPKLRIGVLAEGVIELKPGEHLTVACGSEEVGNHDRVTLGWPGLAHSRGSRRSVVPHRRDGASARRHGPRRRGRHRCRARRHGRLAPGAQRARRAGVAALGGGGGPRPADVRRVDRRRHGRPVLRPPARGHQARARAHAPAADRQDREAPGGRTGPRRSSTRRTA